MDAAEQLAVELLDGESPKAFLRRKQIGLSTIYKMTDAGDVPIGARFQIGVTGVNDCIFQRVPSKRRHAKSIDAKFLGGTGKGNFILGHIYLLVNDWVCWPVGYAGEEVEEAESPKAYLARKNFGFPNLQPLLDMGFVETGSRLKASVAAKEVRHEFTFSPILIRNWPPYHILVVFWCKMHSELLTNFAVYADKMNNEFGPKSSRIGHYTLRPAVAFALLKAWLKHQVTKPPETEEELPSPGKCLNSWGWLEDQLRMRHEQ